MLTIDHKKIDKSVYQLPDGSLNPVTRALETLTMSVGMGKITQDNWREFWARIYIVDQIYGPFLRHADGSDRRLTPADVRAHIGLEANVALESKVTFKTRVINNLRMDAARAVVDEPKTAVARMGEAIDEAGR
jgi:hypothetical protein